MSERELNKCTKCNSRHEGNGEICGICQDTTIVNLTFEISFVKTSNEQLQANLTTANETTERLEQILSSYHIQFGAAMRATSFGLCKRIIKHALEDERSLKGKKVKP